jgi:hypothetical protein
MAEVIIGVDPHKLSATIEVVDDHGHLLGSGRFTTDKVGYSAMRSYVKAWPQRVWAVEGANGAGRPLAQRLVEAGERVVDCSGQARRPGPALRYRPQPQDRRVGCALDRDGRPAHSGAAGGDTRW